MDTPLNKIIVAFQAANVSVGDAFLMDFQARALRVRTKAHLIVWC